MAMTTVQLLSSTLKTYYLPPLADLIAMQRGEPSPFDTSYSFANHRGPVLVTCMRSFAIDAYKLVVECQDCQDMDEMTVSHGLLRHVEHDVLRREWLHFCDRFDRLGCHSSPAAVATVAEWLTDLLARKGTVGVAELAYQVEYRNRLERREVTTLEAVIEVARKLGFVGPRDDEFLRFLPMKLDGPMPWCYTLRLPEEHPLAMAA